MDRMGYTFVQHHTFLLHNIECICNEGVQSKCARRTSGGMMALSNLNSMQVPCDFLKISTLHNDTLGIIMRTGGKSNSSSRCLFTTSLITTAIIFTSVYWKTNRCGTVPQFAHIETVAATVCWHHLLLAHTKCFTINPARFTWIIYQHKAIPPRPTTTTAPAAKVATASEDLAVRDWSVCFNRRLVLVSVRVEPRLDRPTDGRAGGAREQQEAQLFLEQA